MNRHPMTPARRHFLKVSAAEHAAEAASQSVAAGTAVRSDATAYELQLAQLAEHRRALKEIKDTEKKAAFKREVLPTYAPWVRGVLQANSPVQDDVLMTVFVWLLDIGDISSALELGEFALKHGLTMPEDYKRDTASVLVEEASDITLKLLAAEKPVEIEPLLRIRTLTDPMDLHNQVRAKLYKTIGYLHRQIAEVAAKDAEAADEKAAHLATAAQHNAEALKALQRAFELNDKAGVKKDIERLETVIKNAAEPEGTGDTGASGG